MAGGGLLAQSGTPRKKRFAGAIFGLCGLAMLAIGVFLVWTIFVIPLHPEWLPDGIGYKPEGPVETGLDAVFSLAGVATGFVMAFGLVALGLGLTMLITGRVNRLLFFLLLALCAVFVIAGLLLAALNGDRIPRLPL